MSAVVTSTRDTIALLAVAMRAYDRATEVVTCDACGASWRYGELADGHDDDECRWCRRHRDAEAAYVLKPPAPCGYGFATDDDLAAAGVDRAAERARQLRDWAHDLELAVGAGLIDEREARAAWDSRTI